MAGTGDDGRAEGLALVTREAGKWVVRAVSGLDEAGDLYLASGSRGGLVVPAGALPRGFEADFPLGWGLHVSPRAVAVARGGARPDDARPAEAAGPGDPGIEPERMSFTYHIVEALKAAPPEGMLYVELLDEVRRRSRREPTDSILKITLWKFGRRIPERWALRADRLPRRPRMVRGVDGEPAPGRNAYPGTRKAAAAAPRQDWSDARVARLRELVAEGAPVSRIREVLGQGITKSAVISKIHRLGLAKAS